MEGVVDLTHARSAAAVSGAALCAELMAQFNWHDSEFGPQEQWAPAVDAVVRTLLETTVPMAYCHGEDHAMVYNDQFAELLGPKHPSAWGQRAIATLPVPWSRFGLAEMLDTVFGGGPPARDHGELLGLGGGRHLGRDVPQQVGSYSPVRDGDGSILGVLVVVVETIPDVRQIHALLDLVTALAAAVTVDDVAMAALQHAVSALGCGTASICLRSPEQGTWRVARWREIDILDEGAARLPLSWSERAEGALAPNLEVAETGLRFFPEGGNELILPLRGTELTGAVGYLGLHRVPSEAQIALFEASAMLVANAMVRALQFEARRGADALRRTLLPMALPSLPGVTLAGRYHPLTTDAETAGGGDFYDSFSLPDGRLAVTVGDVMGRGVAAATVMGQVRAGMRGAALSNADPSSVFIALDELVRNLDVSWPAMAESGWRSPYVGVAGFGGELFVTALIGILDPASGELLLASAGHVPPAVVRRRSGLDGSGDPHRSVELAPVEPGPPLGIPGDRPVLRLVLDDGDALVAFTEGLLKPHQQSLTVGLERLLATLGNLTSIEPRSICRLLVDDLVGPESLVDDCALLVLLRQAGVHHQASVLVPPQAGAVREARLWVAAQLAAWGLHENVTAAAVMGVSELVTNVILHAGTSAMVSLELAGRLLVTVEDTGDRGAPRRQPSEGRAALRGRGLALVEAISDAMGHSGGVSGSTVWFEIELDGPRAP